MITSQEDEPLLFFNRVYLNSAVVIQALLMLFVQGLEHLPGCNLSKYRTAGCVTGKGQIFLPALI